MGSSNGDSRSTPSAHRRLLIADGQTDDLIAPLRSEHSASYHLHRFLESEPEHACSSMVTNFPVRTLGVADGIIIRVAGDYQEQAAGRFVAEVLSG